MAMRVVLAMSGGVDSSAAARLLLDQGYEVVGLFMRSGAVEETVCAAPGDDPFAIVTPPEKAGHKQGCCSAADAADARRVADRLDIPFHAVNFQEAFGRIKDYFADEYLAGRTPNPCVMCNNWLKFGKLWEFAEQVGAERIATGHYARLVPASGRREPAGGLREAAAARDSGLKRAGGVGHRGADAPRSPALLRGADRSKDQSYVLFGVERALLDRILLPVGEFEKPEIRELARQTGLRVHDKPDSQEICFIPSNDYADFIERHRGPRETAGELVDTAGNVVGMHAGYEQFTIGQRKGLGIAFGTPRFVVAVEPESRRVVIGTHEDLARTELEADRPNWLADVPSRFECLAQIRYRHEPAAAEVRVIDENRFRVRFHEPQYGVAPGQAVVLYEGDRVLGGGWIR
ncbi:MAG: tRNA 2-thiouridine(34) synthase MnmA [Planctomycetaceae bacterium]